MDRVTVRERVRGRDPSVTAGVLGFIGSLLVLGPALRPGSLLDLDLVLTPHPPLGNGIWGLGPEVPRGEPLGSAIALVSQVLDGPFVGKALMILCVTAACAGAARLARPAAPALQVGCGLVYGLSPFMMTRMAVGHFTILAAA